MHNILTYNKFFLTNYYDFTSFVFIKKHKKTTNKSGF